MRAGAAETAVLSDRGHEQSLLYDAFISCGDDDWEPIASGEAEQYPFPERSFHVTRSARRVRQSDSMSSGERPRRKRLPVVRLP